MGPAGPTGPVTVMSQEEADRALERLAGEHEAVESSLFALQDHAGRGLLAGARLTGVTARRWAAAEAATTRLWNAFEVLTAALRDAQQLRTRRRWSSTEDLAELTALLRGPHPLPTEPEAPDQQELPPQPAEATLAELVELMNGWYAQALDTVAAADSVWSALPARIDLLAAELRRVRSLAHSVGVRPGEHPAGEELERATAELTALRTEVVADPLAFWSSAGGSSAPGGGRPDTTRYDAAARTVEDVRREVEAVINVRQDAEQRLLRVRDLLSRADRTLAEARTARGEVLAKIAAYDVPAVSGPPTALHEQLTAAAEHRRRGRWHRLSPLLDSLEASAEDELERARAQLSAVTAPLAVRAELRGRLDACRARAERQGLPADPVLTGHYDTARRMLWSAPCDLRAAEDVVLRYQQAAQEALAARREAVDAGEAAD